MEHLTTAYRLELLVLRAGAYGGAEQRALSRDVERGILLRVHRGVFVERAAYEALTPEGRHVVAMRALTAVSTGEPLFSHWSAAIAQGLPILDRARLARMHLTVPASSRRSVHGAAVHVARAMATDEVVRVGGLLLTSPARIAVDVAVAAPFVEGVVTADAVLHAGVGRAVLEELLDRPGRRPSTRAADVLGFAHRDAESAAESISRCTMLRLGVVPPTLQKRHHDARGFVGRGDFWDEERRIAGEVDGQVKLLDPAMAHGGAGRTLWREKRREDRLLGCVDRLVRWTSAEAGSTALLGPMLAAVGWLGSRARATLADYVAAARPYG